MRINEALDLFLIQLQADGRSHHTRNQYARHVRLLSDWLADGGHSDDVGDVTHQRLAAFLASDTAQRSAHGGTKKAATSNALRTSLRNFFRHLHEAGYIPENPARLIRRALCGEAPPRALADDDREQLLKVLDEAEDDAGRRDRMLVRLLLGTGLRIGSAIALDIEDIDFVRGELRIRSAKANRPDTVIMPSAVADELKGFVRDRRAGPLFVSRNGQRLSVRHASRRFDEWQARAGVQRRVGLHGCRHAFALDVYARCHDLLTVQAALRHRSITSTTVYARVGDDRVRAVLEG